MGKGLIVSILNDGGGEKIIVGTGQISKGDNFEMKNAYILEIDNWNEDGKIEDWIKSSYEKENSCNNVHNICFSKEDMINQEPYVI